MIEDRLQKIESQVQQAENIPTETRTELLDLLSALKSEIASLRETHEEDARSIARFADASAHEATRTRKKPELVQAAVTGLTASVEEFETSHPKLTGLVNRLATILSSMGI